MAPSTIRKAIGAVKDQTSISLAKVAGNIAPELEVLIVKVTSHDNEPADEKLVREIFNLTSYSRSYVLVCIANVLKRLGKTHDWIVALKALMLVHRLICDGSNGFIRELVYMNRNGTRVLNFSGFRDEAHSKSWDFSAFVRTYSLFLDEKLEFFVYDGKLFDRNNDNDNSDCEFDHELDYGMSRKSMSYDDVKESIRTTPLKEMKAERVLERISLLQRLLDKILACRPTGTAKNDRLVIVAVYPIVKESFRVYSDVCEVLEVLMDRFLDMDYVNCVKAFDAYEGAAKQFEELVGFYGWCEDMGIARSSEYPSVQRINVKLLETLEGLLREKAKGPRTPEKIGEEDTRVGKDQSVESMIEIKVLPPPESCKSPSLPVEPQTKPQAQQETPDLVDLSDDFVSADDQGNKLALALFSGPPSANVNGSLWEAFSSNGEPDVTSAWQTPAAESGKADWELALVQSASNLSKQKANLAGGFDSLLLNGMYDQGMVRQHVNSSQTCTGSESSVALPGINKNSMLALPAPAGTVQAVRQDPFAASLMVPPPSYVQVADMEKKQNLLFQEQQLWLQHGKDGMQGRVGSANIGGVSGYYSAMTQPVMPYGMPPVPGIGQPGGYHDTTF
ncbi:AP180 N-terminal homology (ANTH) domain [Dillenia turbinata]|uniref:AP180 N-terminal homology (ANTH) domain n=1 Tax=Dillenia turbinata TaxID=194707 RepID=A0AAN8ZKR8_9MAGN